MTCANCFHSSVCHNYDVDNDVTMCKQFIAPGDVLYGATLKNHLERYGEHERRILKLMGERDALEREVEELSEELQLLRIIKQTLEMQSGMKFDI